MILEGLGYALFKGLVEKYMYKLHSFREFYEKCVVKTPFIVYMSTGLLYSVLSFLGVFSATLYVHAILLNLDVLIAIVASLILALIAFLLSIAFVLYYPVYKARQRGAIIDLALLHTMSYMASIAAAGAPPETVLEIAAEMEDNKEVSFELKRILADIELLGYDTITALTMASRRTPSKTFSMLMVGLKSTIATRGAVWEYLMFFFERSISERIAYLKHVVSSIAVIAEVYITMMVAFPIIFVIMLSVMTLLGGAIAGLDPMLLIFVFLIVVLPAMGSSLLIVLDSILSRV
ncbi:MAG: type II secretion system F family protein [Candidatus Nezhaarchaeales archaeon]